MQELLINLAAIMPEEILIDMLEETIKEIRCGTKEFEDLSMPCHMIILRDMTKGDLGEAQKLSQSVSEVSSVLYAFKGPARS